MKLTKKIAERYIFQLDVLSLAYQVKRTYTNVLSDDDKRYLNNYIKCMQRGLLLIRGEHILSEALPKRKYAITNNLMYQKFLDIIEVSEMITKLDNVHQSLDSKREIDRNETSKKLLMEYYSVYFTKHLADCATSTISVNV